MNTTTIIETLNELPAKLWVILSNLLTWLLAANTAVTWLVANGTLQAWPQAAEAAVVVLSVLGAAIVFVRRVTPVPVSERGLL